MIVIINGVYPELTRAVARHLAARFASGAVIDGADSLPGSARDLVTPTTLGELEPLTRLRRRLFQYDDTTYVFRLVHAPEALADRAGAELAERQERAADEGDIGYPILVGGDQPEQLARLIWDNLHEPVELVVYDPGWQQQFRQEHDALSCALGELVLELHHIGSTAVPGLIAKPVIDIMAGLRSLEHAVACIARLRPLGYIFADYPQNLERRFFRKGFPRTHHLHLVEHGSRSLTDHLRFRDALRADPGLHADYATLKRELTAADATDRAAYGERKTRLIRRALAARR